MTKKSHTSCCQFDSNAVYTVNYIEKIIFAKLACYVGLPGPFCVAHAHWKPNHHNQNFVILQDSLHKVMSKKSNRVKHSHKD